VEDIAETAGYSIGAIYSNFHGKEQLLLALLDEHVGASAARLSERFEAVAADPAARRRAIGEHFDHLAADHRSCWLLSTELWRYALRNPELRPALVKTQERCRSSIARIVESVFEQNSSTPPVPSEEIARIVDALADGLIRQRLLEPDAVSGETFRRAVEWLFAGALRQVGDGAEKEEVARC
jgi:AcrR family transcriptional regulator